MQIIDTRGQLCPAPLILTRRAIKNAPEGGQFTVITDNDTARHNLLSFLAEMGLQVSCVKQGEEYHLVFSTNGKPAVMPEVDTFCETTKKTANHVVTIKSEQMGQGSEELGKMLMRSCINTLMETEPLPGAVILYNGGVLLAKKGSDTADSLEKLAMQGVIIIVCGTCVDYFGIKEELIDTAQISNMYKINSMLATASSVIYP